MRIILASASPRRAMILRQAGIPFEVLAGSVPEDIVAPPEQTVRVLSQRKAEAAAGVFAEGDAAIVAADTVVACGDRILGKPADREDALRMLRMLAGGSHFVYTGVTIMAKKGEISYQDTFVEKTKVHIYEMSEEQISAYADTGEPMDKAGAYALQGRFAVYVKGIEGDYYTVVGLPIAAICQRMQRAGFAMLP